MENIDTTLMNAEEIKIAYAKRREENAKENKLRLRLHLWTKEEYKDKALRECALKTYDVVKKAITNRVTEKIEYSSNPQVQEVRVNRFVDNFVKKNIYYVRFPSICYLEMNEFIEDIATRDNYDTTDYICFSNDIYKYIDIHFKHFLTNGAIQIYIDGINYTKNPTMYNVNLALMIAINATDNSLKFRNAISNPNK